MANDPDEYSRDSEYEESEEVEARLRAKDLEICEKDIQILQGEIAQALEDLALLKHQRDFLLGLGRN